MGEERCWVGIGGDSSLILEDWDRVAGLYDVTLQSDYSRNVKLEQIMGAPVRVCLDADRICAW